MMDNMSGVGGAAYFKSQHEGEGCHRKCEHHDMNKLTKSSSMNKAEMNTVKKSEAKQMATKDRQLASDKKESAMYGMKTSKKMGGK
jgi:hypothetical protein